MHGENLKLIVCADNHTANEAEDAKKAGGGGVIDVKVTSTFLGLQTGGGGCR